MCNSNSNVSSNVNNNSNINNLNSSKENVMMSYVHVSECCTPMSFPIIYIGHKDNKLALYSIRYCVVCGKEEAVYGRGEFATHCGKPTSVLSETKMDGIVRDFVQYKDIPLSDFVRIKLDDTMLLDQEDWTEKQDLIQLLMVRHILPIGSIDTDGTAWACVRKAIPVIEDFFKTIGGLAGYGHYLFSDTYFRAPELTCVYNNDYEKHTGTDGSGNLIALSLVLGILQGGKTPSRVQFRLLGTDVFAKGVAIVVKDTDPALMGKQFVVGSSSIKVGHISENTEFSASVLLMKMESYKRRRGMPGWELISFLPETDKVNNYLNAKVAEKVTKMAKAMFSNDKEVINDMLYNPDKTEKEQTWIAQIVRSALPINNELIGKHMIQMFLSRSADLIMGSGIESDLHMAACDNRIVNLDNTAIRMPFIGGIDALIKCTVNGIFHSDSMTNQTGLDADGDDLHVLSADDATFLKDNMIAIGNIHSVYSAKKISISTSILMMAQKYIEMLSLPNIGHGVNSMAKCLFTNQPELANRGASLAHFCAQGIKKTIVDSEGNPVDVDKFVESFELPKIKMVDFGRIWYKSILERKETKKDLSINHFQKAVDEYDEDKHPGILARRVAEGCKIVVDIYNMFDMNTIKWAKAAPLTEEQMLSIFMIKKAWKNGTYRISQLEGNKSVAAGFRKDYYAKVANHGKTIKDDVGTAIVYDALISGKSYMAEKVLPKSIGDYLGYASFLIGTVN